MCLVLKPNPFNGRKYRPKPKTHHLGCTSVLKCLWLTPRGSPREEAYQNSEASKRGVACIWGINLIIWGIFEAYGPDEACASFVHNIEGRCTLINTTCFQKRRRRIVFSKIYNFFSILKTDITKINISQPYQLVERPKKNQNCTFFYLY